MEWLGEANGLVVYAFDHILRYIFWRTPRLWMLHGPRFCQPGTHRLRKLARDFLRLFLRILDDSGIYSTCKGANTKVLLFGVKLFGPLPSG